MNHPNGPLVPTKGDGTLEPTQLSPSQSLLDAVMAETVGMAMHHAVTAQNNTRMLATAAVTATCARLINTPTLHRPQQPPPNTEDFSCSKDPKGPDDPKGLGDLADFGTPAQGNAAQGNAAPKDPAQEDPVHDAQSMVERAQSMVQQAAMLMQQRNAAAEPEPTPPATQSMAEWCAATK